MAVSVTAAAGEVGKLGGVGVVVGIAVVDSHFRDREESLTTTTNIHSTAE